MKNTARNQDSGLTSSRELALAARHTIIVTACNGTPRTPEDVPGGCSHEIAIDELSRWQSHDARETNHVKTTKRRYTVARTHAPKAGILRTGVLGIVGGAMTISDHALCPHHIDIVSSCDAILPRYRTLFFLSLSLFLFSLFLFLSLPLLLLTRV